MGWLGALAVLLGVAFFVAIAIGRGWLGETARIALAYVGSGGLLVAGAWLHEKRGRTQASLAMVGTGVASAFMTTTAAIQLYHLFPAPAGLVIAFGIGSIATLLAIHWNSRTIAGIGIIGALLAPVMVGAGSSDAGIGFVAIALAAATGVLLWRKWEWLALAAFAVSAPQFLDWADQSDSAIAVVVIGLAFWGLYMVAALGYDLRVKGTLPRTTACVLAIAAPLVASAGGYWTLRSLGHSAAGDWLIAGLGLAHIALGVTARRSTKVSIEVERLLFAGGLAMANTAYGLIASGPAVSIGWAAGAVGLGFLARKGKVDRELTTLALGAQLCLSLLHTLLFDAPPADTLATFTGGSSAVASLGALAVSAFVCARLAHESKTARIAFDVTALVALAYATPFAVSGVAVTIAWAGQAVALARIAYSTRDGLARGGAYTFLGLAIMDAVLGDAPVSLLAHSGFQVEAVAGLATVALAAYGCARLEKPASESRVVLSAIAAAAVAYMMPFAFDGPALVGAWGLGAVAFALWARLGGATTAEFGTMALAGAEERPARNADALVARIAGPVFLVLASLHALSIDATPMAAASGDLLAWPAVVALALVAAAGLGAAYVLELPRPETGVRATDWLAPYLRATGLAAALYAPAFVLNDAPLVAVWAAAALGLAADWRKRQDEVSAGAAVAVAAVATVHALAFEAPITALSDGVKDLPSALLAVGAIAAALIGASRLMPEWLGEGRVRLTLEALGGIAAVYAVSVAIVTLFPGHAALDSQVGGLGVRQQGQMLLSAFWAATGLGTLVWGLLHDVRARRIGGLALLTLALGKVFLYDLATLESIYRVVSFVALGVLLLIGAFAWQRMRPEHVEAAG